MIIATRLRAFESRPAFSQQIYPLIFQTQSAAALTPEFTKGVANRSGELLVSACNAQPGGIDPGRSGGRNLEFRRGLVGGDRPLDAGEGNHGSQRPVAWATTDPRPTPGSFMDPPGPVKVISPRSDQSLIVGMLGLGWLLEASRLDSTGRVNENRR